MRVDHVVFSPDDARFLFLARYAIGFHTFNSALWTIGNGGINPFLVVNYNEGISHFEWIDEENLIVTLDMPDNFTDSRKIKRHIRIQDQNGAHRIICPKFLHVDGHPTMHPTGKAFATDTYPIKGWRYVYLIDYKTEEFYQLTAFQNPDNISGDWRCDPHPRWRSDGKKLAFDGIGPNGRQIFLIDVEWV
jgi:hypothetical protein